MDESSSNWVVEGDLCSESPLGSFNSDRDSPFFHFLLQRFFLGTAWRFPGRSDLSGPSCVFSSAGESEFGGSFVRPFLPSEKYVLLQSLSGGNVETYVMDASSCTFGGTHADDEASVGSC